MPPKPKTYVYHVIQRDYEHHTDRKGSMSLISTHTTEAGATKAAKARLSNETEKNDWMPSDKMPIKESTKGKDNLYFGNAHVCEDTRDNVTVEVKKALLVDDGVPIGGNENHQSGGVGSASSSGPSKKRKSGPQVIELD